MVPRPSRSALIAGLALGGLVAREARRTSSYSDPAERAQAVRRKIAVATWRAPSEGRLMTPSILSLWLQRVLPPPGRPQGYSAGLWDWVRHGQDVLGEPEDTRVWPGYASRTPGRRPQVLFDPVNGMPAYPFLRPHLGRRPPFAPGHGPAPYLDPTSGAGLPAPGADGPASVCPAGTTLVPLPVTALLTPVQLAAAITDPHGELYVRNEELASYRANVRQRAPLVVRARAQRECLDVTLVSALTDDAETHGLSKADMCDSRRAGLTCRSEALDLDPVSVRGGT